MRLCLQKYIYFCSQRFSVTEICTADVRNFYSAFKNTSNPESNVHPTNTDSLTRCGLAIAAEVLVSPPFEV